jgi:hypothetical protein
MLWRAASRFVEELQDKAGFLFDDKAQLRAGNLPLQEAANVATVDCGCRATRGRRRLKADTCDARHFL